MLYTFLVGLPVGCILLIIAGSPCQQLTVAGYLKGVLGLCGKDSYLFFSIPLVRWAVSIMRPDIVIHIIAGKCWHYAPMASGGHCEGPESARPG